MAQLSPSLFLKFIHMLVCPSMVSSFPLMPEYTGSSAFHFIPFLFAVLVGMMETEVPLSAIQVSVLLVDFPSTLPLISGDDLFFLIGIWVL